MIKTLLTACATYAPSQTISNEELVASFNAYVQNFNEMHQQEIIENKIEPLKESSEAFILKASGIKNRYVIDKKNILDVNIMRPVLPDRSNESISIQAEFALPAAKLALERAQKKPEDVDFVLVACSNFQRPYPAIAIEIQNILGCKGYAFDMNVACSSATFALQTASNAIQTGNCKTALILNPEITSAHLNFCDRDSHFIFGDACTASILEGSDLSSHPDAFEILSTKIQTQFSNNIRNNFGFLAKTYPENIQDDDKYFKQNGRQVFKDISPFAVRFIQEHLKELNIPIENIKRFWMHQANLNMNNFIIEKLLGENINPEKAPMILDEYANTASAGSLICFDHYHNDFQPGEIGLLSSFGAGYSIGSVILKKV